MYSSKRVQNPEFLEVSYLDSQSRMTTPTLFYERWRHKGQPTRRLQVEDWNDQPLYSLLMKTGNFFPTIIVDDAGVETNVNLNKSILGFLNISKTTLIEIEW